MDRQADSGGGSGRSQTVVAVVQADTVQVAVAAMSE